MADADTLGNWQDTSECPHPGGSNEAYDNPQQESSPVYADLCRIQLSRENVPSRCGQTWRCCRLSMIVLTGHTRKIFGPAALLAPTFRW